MKKVEDITASMPMSPTILKINDNYLDQFELTFIFTVKPSQKTFKQEITEHQSFIDTLLSRASVELENESISSSLVSYFSFPYEIQTSCEQYLVYFVQFLRDLGIQAEADLKHEAHQVLFSVRPKDGAEALEQIREALNVYLNLPSAPDFEAVASQERDIAVIQLNAQVAHLKSQLMLAQATMQAKDAAIDLLKLTNFRLNEELAQSRQIAKWNV